MPLVLKTNQLFQNQLFPYYVQVYDYQNTQYLKCVRENCAQLKCFPKEQSSNMDALVVDFFVLYVKYMHL